MKKGRIVLEIESDDDTLVQVAVKGLDLKFINAVLRPYVKGVVVTAVRYDIEGDSTEK